MIAHNWEIKDLWEKDEIPTFTVEDSIAYFKNKGVKIGIFTSTPGKVTTTDTPVFMKNEWKTETI